MELGDKYLKGVQNKKEKKDKEQNNYLGFLLSIFDK